MPAVVLLSDPRIAAIPVASADGGGLVDVSGAHGLVIDTRKADPAGHWHHVRPALARMLEDAAAHATREGLALRLVEGYRPGSLQTRYFDEYVATLRGEDDDRSESTLRSLAARHVSPPDVAPHTAGGAVDVTLELDGVELDLGCPYNPTPVRRAARCYTDHPDVRGAAADHRRALIDIMSAAGFVNYPTEWWHWSFGDRYWAWATGAEEALFGPA